MKCEDCGCDMIYLQGACICPICDGYEEEPDTMNKTMDDDKYWVQNGQAAQREIDPEHE